LTGRSDDGQALQDIAYWIDWNGGVVHEPVEDMMRVDARICMPDDRLLCGDKVSMAFHSKPVCQSWTWLPRPYRIGLAKRKVVHKMMAKRYLPPTSSIGRSKPSLPLLSAGRAVRFGSASRSYFSKSCHETDWCNRTPSSGYYTTTSTVRAGPTDLCPVHARQLAASIRCT
jgi:asparagine synthase (glutamine-hydrolysing)